MKITATSYYEPFPATQHRTGDIWSNLPGHHLVGTSTVTGVVITPACDLENSKVDAIAYLPVVSLRRWICSPLLRPTLAGVLRGLAQTLSTHVDNAPSHDPFATDEDEELLKITRHLIAELEPRRDKLKTSVRSALDRACRGADILEAAASWTSPLPSVSDLQALFTNSGWERECRRHVTNSSRSDAYFLPRDQEEPEYSAIPEHSVVLFRYPMSAPIAALDRANDVLCKDWHHEITALAESLHSAQPFDPHRRPVKLARLRDAFLVDMLSKYTALWARVGSPDFSEITIKQLISTMDTTQA